MPRPPAAPLSWWLAGACGAWMVVFLVPVDRGGLVAVPLAVAGVADAGRAPVRAATLVLAANVVTALAGAPWGDVDMVAAIAVVMFALGRHVPRAAVGIVAAVLFALTSAARAPFDLGSVAVALAVFGGPWAYGRVVHRRDVAAAEAARAAELVAQQDPDRLSARLVAEERRHLAGTALGSLRTAVAGMSAAAEGARADLDPVRIDAIRAIGADAVAELRDLLGLLREPQPARAARSDPSDGGAGRVRWWADAALALALGGAATATVAGVGSGDGRLLPVVVLHLAVVGAVALRRASPVLACLVAAAATVLVAVEPPTDPTVLLPASAGYALLVWTSVVGAGRRALVALGILVIAVTAAAAPFGSEALGYMALSFGGPGLARLTWRDRDELLRSAEERRHGLQVRLDRAAAEAVHAERLRIARDLHDVTSHAVGVMAMQAGAARALLPTAPERARAALLTAVRAGSDAAVEIDELVAALDLETGIEAPARNGGGPGTSPPHRALDELIARMADAGMDLTARVGELPEDRVLFEAAFRVVQEGLTNASRHAPGSRVDVDVDRGAEGYVVRVGNRADGRHRPDESDPWPTGGFGLVGLAERVRSLGGAISAGPDGADGFAVVAHLPLTPGRRLPDRVEAAPVEAPLVEAARTS